jgi:formylglycine-generating enzyme required for sulfatase activity
VAFLLDTIPTGQSSEAPNVITALAAAKDSAAPALLLRVEQELKNPQVRTRYAIALLHLGDPGAAERLLALDPDPTYRTAFIHTFPTWHGDLRPLAALLRRIKTPGFQSGLCAALGLAQAENLAVDERAAVKNALMDLYADPTVDGGAHSAACWALRQWHEEPPVLATSRGPEANGRWFVNGLNMTMVRVPEGKYLMGDPANPKWARQHEVEFTRPFFVCDREVWVDLFEQFLKDPNWPDAEKPLHWQGHHKGVSPTPDCPQDMVNWYDALLFCNWLSFKEKRTPCYSRLKNQAVGKGGAGKPEIWECDFNADGYRLSTEAEWEYLCRAGTTTAYFFGADPKRLPSYGFFSVNSDFQAWPGGMKLPNAWGLFDTYGNVEEWCWDWFAQEYPPEKTDPRGPPSGEMRTLRGGFFSTPKADFLHSDYRSGRLEPQLRLPQAGFRVVFTATRANSPSGER